MGPWKSKEGPSPETLERSKIHKEMELMCIAFNLSFAKKCLYLNQEIAKEIYSKFIQANKRSITILSKLEIVKENISLMGGF